MQYAGQSRGASSRLTDPTFTTEQTPPQPSTRPLRSPGGFLHSGVFVFAVFPFIPTEIKPSRKHGGGMGRAYTSSTATHT